MKQYKIGYVPGTFDLFHIGHLNLIRRSKERCAFLIVGVCTDELVETYKGHAPYVPFAERIEIVEAIRFVDRAVKVDFENTDKIAAWKMFHFDCHFAGDDHAGHWEEERRFLSKMGVSMEFFPYTKEQSTTQLRSKLV